MAILIEGKTVCGFCKQPIYSKADAVGIPNMSLPAELAAMKDSVVHRTCLTQHPKKNLMSAAWASHWQGIASTSGQQAVILEGGMELKIKRRLIMVQFDTYIEIEELLEDADRFNKFFSSVQDGANGDIVLSWNRYEISWDGDSPQLVVAKVPAGIAARAIAPSVDRPADVSLRYTFSSDEWNTFRSICRESA